MTRHRTIIAIVLAWLVGLAALVYAWYEQYAVDAEVTLLPWLMGRGWLLYRDLIDQHPPLLPLLLVPLNGDPGLPLRVLILALRGLTLALTYVVGARLAGVWGGLVALAGAALWALGTDGAHLWYDGALAPVYLGVVLLLAGRVGNTLKSDATSPPAISIPVAMALGGLLAIGMLLKQHAVLAIPGVALALAWGMHAGRVQRLVAFVAGLALPLLLVGCYYAFQGAASEAAYWIFAYTFDGNYVGGAGLAPSPDEWQWLAIAFAPAVALLLAGAAVGPRVAWRALHPSMSAPRTIGLLLAAPWLLLATILPVWPRYGRIHLQAAVPLLAVVAGAAVVVLGYAISVLHPSRATRRSRVLTILAALLLSAYALGGLREGVSSFSVQTTLGPVASPYAATAPPLAAWIDAHTVPGAPIMLYGVDPLLYRVMGHPPPRPWSPQLPWILSAHGIDARLWAGVVAARPAVALVAASWWDDGEPPSLEPGPGWLRAMYHAAARFDLVSYSGAPSVSVVALLLDDGKPLSVLRPSPDP